MGDTTRPPAGGPRLDGNEFSRLVPELAFTLLLYLVQHGMILSDQARSTEMTTTTARLEIELAWTTDESSLFAVEADMDGVDVQESMANFDGWLIAAVRAAFPEAVVEMADRGRIWEVAEDGAVNGADTPACLEAQLAIQSIVDQIHQDGKWIMEAAGCDRCGDTAFTDGQLVESRGVMVCGACALSAEATSDA